jgi:CcmD family protein
MKIKNFLLLLALFCCVALKAQEPASNELPGFLITDGMIRVVALVLAIVMAGILLYLFLIDRKVSRLEKEIKNKGK